MTSCVAPATLVSNTFREADGDSFYNTVVIVASLSIAILGILRLARFSLSQNRWRDFIGLPTPAFAMIVVSLSSLYHWSIQLEMDAEYFNTGDTILVPGLLFILSWSMITDVLYRKYRGRILLFAAFIIFTMLMSLLFGVHEPILGMTGAIIFTAAAFGYFFSPVLQGPRNIWGARRRLESDPDSDPEEDLLPEDMEDPYEDY
jgi:phosphatidylserine synthase